jgi:uncharacterized membrane protein
MRMPRPTIVTAAAGALTLATIAGTAGYLLGEYAALPQTLPVEFRDGLPYQFIGKSYVTVLTPVWTQLLMALVFGAIAVVLLWRSHGAATPEHESDAMRMLHAAEAISLLALVWIAFQVATAVGLIRLWTLFYGGMGPFYERGFWVALVLSIAIGVRARMKIGRSDPRLSGDRRVWWRQALYFNPADPALFAPARGGRGFTMNFGRPLAIALVLALVAIGLGAPIIIARLFLR